MSKLLFDFTVLGKAQTAGSKRAFPFRKKGGALGVRVSDDNPDNKSWQHAVRTAAREAYDGPLLDGPLFVGMTFYVPRPKGHFGSGRNAGVLKPTAPSFPVTRPDALKLARAVEDALTGTLWRDDSQIVDEALLKHYGEPARVAIYVGRPD